MSMPNVLTITELYCKRCKTYWLPRIRKPLACPHCKRYDWDTDKEAKDDLIVAKAFRLSARYDKLGAKFIK